jgi:GH25 family lysozyme M1 (1,4-beta-N-acetylmuramidase)
LKLFAEGIMEGSFNDAGQRVFLGGDRLRRSEVCAVLVRVQDYVARTWILFAGYRIPINYDLAFNPYDPAAFYKENGRTRYDDGATAVRYGIDVSWYQGAIDWEKVAADGVEFAIIRCGYRGSSTGEISEDSYFQDNIRGALENGIEVGVYFFSQALNVQEAMEELRFTLDLIRGWNITMPVVFDWEQYGNRTASPNWSAVTDCIVAFCDGVAAAGYTPMTYYNPSMAYLRLDLPRLQGYPTWLAHYVDVTDYHYDFQMWQYGSSGAVDGIQGRVDMDILFTSFN